jgi:hypothetical protein
MFSNTCLIVSYTLTGCTDCCLSPSEEKSTFEIRGNFQGKVGTNAGVHASNGRDWSQQNGNGVWLNRLTTLPAQEFARTQLGLVSLLVVFVDRLLPYEIRSCLAEGGVAIG